MTHLGCDWTKGIAILPHGDRTSFRAKGLAGQEGRLEIAVLPQFLAIEPHFVQRVCGTAWKSQFYLSFWRSNLISCENVRGQKGRFEIAILPQLLAIEPHFGRKGCDGTRGTAILLQLLAIEPHFVRNGCAEQLANRNFTPGFGDRTSFRAKGFAGQLGNRNFTSVFVAIEPHFVRNASRDKRDDLKSRGCVSCRLVGTAPRLQERNRKEGEGKRARGQEEKM